MAQHKIYEIWSEGYWITGGGGPAQYVGNASGENFQHACERFYKGTNPHQVGNYNPVANTVWGCKLYETEAEARKSFG